MLLAQMTAAEIAELEAYVTDISSQVEELLDEILPAVEENDPESRLHEAMRYSVYSGGKRLRPVLVMASNALLGGNKQRALRTACAMEVLHTYSLIHDDLPCMDDDDLRRGKPTCHMQFDEATAVLAGDALLTLTFEILSDEKTHPDPMVRAELVQLFASAAGSQGMVGGQMLDIMAEGHEDEMDQGALARLQRKKTGALFSACCEAAIILNGSTNDEHHRLSSYSRNIGLAFQMVDDVLDEVGEEGKLGKKVGADKDKGKATFAHLLGVEGASRQAKFLCTQAVDYLSPFGDKALILRLLAKFVVARSH
jgi:farnesyl diphosphate synthase